jgi:hypothetical protein
MAVKLVLIGIVAGLLAATSTLALGGGVGLVFLAYMAGGMAGMGIGLASLLMPKDGVAVKVSADLSHPRPGVNARHPT